MTWDNVELEGWFSIDVPQGWSVEEDDGVIGLLHPGGDKAIHISCFHRQSNAQPSADEVLTMAGRFADHHRWVVEKEAVRVFTATGQPAADFTVLDADDEGNFWHVCHFIDPTRAVLMTYLCPNDDAETDQSAIEHIVSSFKWERVAVEGRVM